MRPEDYPHESSMYYRALDQQDIGPCPRAIAAYAIIDGKSVRIALSQDAYDFVDSAEEAELRRQDQAAHDESEAQRQDWERNQ